MAKIGLDIGHGKNTFPPSKGVYQNGRAYHEYDANSRVARQLEAKLKNAGHSVYKAQPYNANDVPLKTRTQRYFANNVDLIISCHANAGVEGANGYASFYWQGDSRAKKFSDLYADEIAKQGFKLWGGSRPSVQGTWSSFHMCSAPSRQGIPSILIENGFMTHNGDFQWIFGNKKDEYAEKCATAAFNAIQRFLGQSTNIVKPKETKTGSEQITKPKTANKTINQLADEVIAGKHGSGNDRKNSLGSQYNAVQKRVNEMLGAKPKAKPKSPQKSIDQLVKETLAGKHGNGDKRKKALGKDYQAVMNVINGKTTASKQSKSGQSVSQMASKIINDSKAPTGHEARRKWLGISKAEYEKVRKEVNKRL